MSILKQLVFTPKCLICQKLGVNFCLDCTAKAKPFRARSLSEIELSYCVGEYSGWLRDAIICYKNGDGRYSELLSHLLSKALAKLPDYRGATLIPIPSSPQKIKERGFDSMASLCKGIDSGREFVKIDATNLFLRKSVTDQVGLDAAARRANLERAFSARRNLSGTVVIVDDVVTTGATLNSAARTLKYAGAQRVFALALCGTPQSR